MRRSHRTGSLPSTLGCSSASRSRLPPTLLHERHQLVLSLLLRVAGGEELDQLLAAGGVPLDHGAVDLGRRVIPAQPLRALREQLQDSLPVDDGPGLLQRGTHERSLLNQTLGGRLLILRQLLVELAKSRDLSLDALNLFFLGVKSHNYDPLSAHLLACPNPPSRADPFRGF